MRGRPTIGLALATAIAATGCSDGAGGTSAGPGEAPAPLGGAQLLVGAENNRLRRYDLDTVRRPPVVQDVVIESAGGGAEFPGALPGSRNPVARDINGQICLLPGGETFVAGEDTGQPSPPAGWGVFTLDGTQIGKLTATYYVDGAEPFGCAVDPEGRLFTGEVGNQFFDEANGQLILWFPPFDHFPGPPGAYPDTNEPSTNFCKIATDLATTGSITSDTEGNLYVTEASGFQVRKYSPPWPTGPDAAGGCGRIDALGSPMADEVNVETFIRDPQNLLTPTGIVQGPNGNFFASAVFTGVIAEYDRDGRFVRRILSPRATIDLPIETGHPQSLIFDALGNLYYADIRLTIDEDGIGPLREPFGKIWRIGFEDGEPQAPLVVRDGLAFPEGLGILPGDLEASAPDWPTYAGADHRRFHNPNDDAIGPDTLLEEDGTSRLALKWQTFTGAIVSASPSVARVPIEGEGTVAVSYILSWDGSLYAIRVSDGAILWSFYLGDNPGATFPYAGSAHVGELDGRPVVYVGGTEFFHAVDAATGEPIWVFTAGTGCEIEGICGFDAERNQIEASPIVAEGKVFFGMDVNETATGKGGFYALNTSDGSLAWFFDLESGRTCRPFPEDDVRRYDGYHSEAELGLPGDFFATRPGCDHPRSRNGCSNIWSSPALDPERRALYFASSNCITDDDPATGRPAPPMPPWDEAIVAIDVDGDPLWRWRPREVDNDDLAFGAVPNLFTIDVAGERRDVVGVGNKDGTYYVIDREGVNVANGVRWDDADASALPYWQTQVVAGGRFGGIIATAAVDERAGLVMFGTAPGFEVFEPQQPTVHALDMQTGEIVWQNVDESPQANANFAPTSAVGGLAFVGSSIGAFLRTYDTESGEKLTQNALQNFGGASGPAVVDGTLMLGAGIGRRSDSLEDILEETTWKEPSPLRGFCILGTPGCAPGCDAAADRDGDGHADGCDLCPDDFDPSQRDSDGDGLGDACDDTCPGLPPTTIARVSRSSGAAGEGVVIEGEGFGADARVWFGPVAGEVTSANPMSIGVRVPEIVGIDEVALYVANPAGCRSDEDVRFRIER